MKSIRPSIVGHLFEIPCECKWPVVLCVKGLSFYKFPLRWRGVECLKCKQRVKVVELSTEPNWTHPNGTIPDPYPELHRALFQVNLVTLGRWAAEGRPNDGSAFRQQG